MGEALINKTSLLGLVLLFAFALPMPEAFCQTTPVVVCTPEHTLRCSVYNGIAQMGPGPALLSAFSYICGLVLMVTGGVKLNEHAASPTNVKLSAGVGRLLVGSGLIGLPTFLGWIQTTVGVSGSSLGLQSFPANMVGVSKGVP